MLAQRLGQEKPVLSKPAQPSWFPTVTATGVSAKRAAGIGAASGEEIPEAIIISGFSHSRSVPVGLMI
ncbi:hypothetical protein [Mastigocladopsis repens]|uniref:hypothetical protein n=1 Tax=Mastigocladopsis repens TaxID=221287 RepID=UPI000318043E|nr:hypothetical protein [Mastigocladopsis repens]